jgi:myo-inositol-1(or 4)-monophosphatase
MSEELSIALELAKKAGKLIKDNFHLGMKKEYKSDNSELTATDTAVNNLVINTIKNNFPTHSVLSEEGSFKVENSDYVWVCDPIDGTFPFSHGIPTCVFSLALTKKGVPILGVIYDPFIDRLFLAEKGKGAFLNNKKISVSDKKEIAHAAIGSSMGGRKSKLDIIELKNKIYDLNAKIIDLGSITYMGCLVCCGELDANIFTGKNPWDSAALKIIAEEAGAIVTSISGEEQLYDGDINGHLIANPALHKILLKLIKEFIKS